MLTHMNSWTEVCARALRESITNGSIGYQRKIDSLAQGLANCIDVETFRHAVTEQVPRNALSIDARHDLQKRPRKRPLPLDLLEGYDKCS